MEPLGLTLDLVSPRIRCECQQLDPSHPSKVAGLEDPEFAREYLLSLPPAGPPARKGGRASFLGPYSHSMVAGGLLVISYTTRLTPGTSLTMRLLMAPSKSGGIRAQSAVMKSSVVTARMAIVSA
jgi:hypothetical protein